MVAACGGGDLLLPSSGEPAHIEIVRGNEQADTVGRPLPDSLVVLVTDPEARPVAGVEVTFVAYVVMRGRLAAARGLTGTIGEQSEAGWAQLHP